MQWYRVKEHSTFFFRGERHLAATGIQLHVSARMAGRCRTQDEFLPIDNSALVWDRKGFKVVTKDLTFLSRVSIFPECRHLK